MKNEIGIAFYQRIGHMRKEVSMQECHLLDDSSGRGWGLGSKWYDVIIGPIARGDPPGKPTGGYERRN